MGGGAKPDNREFPTKADDYELLEECGQGAAGKVWRALCKPLNVIVAVKLLDLENMNCNLDEIIQEAKIMKQSNHENILSLHCSFVHQENLWMVMPYVKGGSVLNIMKYAFPKGLEEPVISTIMKEVLKALDYVHKHNQIHRDVKAGNILIDSHGNVKLADFGVAATMNRDDSKRQTFVGTPCWMAPEVMEQTHGYDCKADIWSFGITLLELAHGMAPFAKYPPMKVLMMTLQQPPPQLQATGEKQFSKEMQQLVGLCLVKDPMKRPTAARLLEHRFFKHTHDNQYLIKHVLTDLPPLTERLKLMRAQKGPGGIMEKRQAMEKSQEEYIKGVSAWDFDVAKLKQQAAMEPDDGDDGWNFDPAPAAAAAPEAPPVASVPVGTEEAAAAGEAALKRHVSVEVPKDGGNPGGMLSPSGGSKDSTGSAITPPPSAKASHQMGRFQVVQPTPDVPDEHESPSASIELPPGHLDQHAASNTTVPPNLPLGRSTSGSGLDTEGQPKKRTSRFNIRSEADEGLPPKPITGASGIQRAQSAANVHGVAEVSDRRSGHPTSSIKVDSLLPHLESMLKVHQKQGEEMASVFNAMRDASQGKAEALRQLAATSPTVHLERLLPSDNSQVTNLRRTVDKLQARVKELEDENKRVAHDYEKLRQKLERSQQALLAD
eukprot:CAMPEP_0177779678 /NCGR_PEP_ID=MMETSP0491_2-20121128/16740_1 /TAXON_ID=63592 /ORGANISM="Tetraselmis chuii, Strain PLY429" /LENGTH=661 /DNA_ID=CAMNT_0019299283 /DNA_START=435 /DNA_END=2420 /DNA_ORIENTATION=-